MFRHDTIAFRMPAGLPAVSVAFLNDGTFVAADGRTCEVAVFSDTGEYLCSHCTTRAYRALRLSTSSLANGLFFALGRCCSGTPNRVYILNSRFEEIGSFDLVPDETASCDDVGELMDIAPVGDEIHATFRHSVRSHSTSGAQTGIVLPTDRTRLLLRYAVSGTARALSFCKNGTTFINVAEIGAVYLGTSPDGFALRDLARRGLGDVWGLFGYRYLYNYLTPIYQNGAFDCSAAE